MGEQILVALLVVRLSQPAMIMMPLSMNTVSLLTHHFLLPISEDCSLFYNDCLYTGLERQPKWGHLKDLHRAIKLCEPALLSGESTRMPLGNYQEVSTQSLFHFLLLLFLVLVSLINFCTFVNVQAHVYKSKSGACSAFLANYNPRSYAKISFGSNHYNLPPWSISILPDCKNTVYNTARVRRINLCSTRYNDTTEGSNFKSFSSWL